MSRRPEGSPRDPVEYKFEAIQEGALPTLVTYIGYCCREWVMAYGYPAGTCGYCGERPAYLRADNE